MKSKTKLEKNVKKLCQLLKEENNKTPFEKQKEYNAQLKILNDKYQLKFFQLKQDFELQKKVLFDRFNSQ